YIIEKDKDEAECWYAIKDVREGDSKLVRDEMHLNLPETEVGRRMLDFFHSDEEQVSILMKGEMRKEWINYCASRSSVLQ
ncbi:hypothetical protein NL529_33410, partial [Klebsiella pneumoniae]|nr:hypothetical protein [Klebsiella pneumoniae]